MKVLFAVSNDNITTSVVNKYQQKYKEIVTSKNVYYFNAIVKELQQDKSYDAIVIEEDLEPISNNNYEAIDNFLYDKLDNISDEASKATGEDIPIILICSDRRTKSDELLRKLFSMSIYNALIGNDRSLDKLCDLLKKPRNKKDAKKYYQIDTDQIEYQSQKEELVSEEQIRSILSYYQKIGTNEGKCVKAFESIARQYDNTQLRIIVKFLPMDVKAILEAHSSTYQKLMSNGTVLSNGQYSPYNPNNPKKLDKLDFISKDVGTGNSKPSKPVIIPSNMRLQNIEEQSINKQQPNTNNAFMQKNINTTQQYGNNSFGNNTMQQQYNGQYAQHNQNPYNNYNTMRQSPYNGYQQQNTNPYAAGNSMGQSAFNNNPQQGSPYNTNGYNMYQNNASATNQQGSRQLNNLQYNTMQQNKQQLNNTQYNATEQNTQQNKPQEGNLQIGNTQQANNNNYNNIQHDDIIPKNIQPENKKNDERTQQKDNKVSFNNEINIAKPAIIEQNKPKVQEENRQLSTINTVNPIKNTDTTTETTVEPVKRGRGRPRKIKLNDDVVPKEKRKRGRPRKIIPTTEIENADQLEKNNEIKTEKMNGEIAPKEQETFNTLSTNEEKPKYNNLISNEEKALPNNSTRMEEQTISNKFVGNQEQSIPNYKANNYPTDEDKLLKNVVPSENKGQAQVTQHGIKYSGVSQTSEAPSFNDIINSVETQPQPINLYDLGIDNNDQYLSNTNSEIDLGIEPIENLNKSQNNYEQNQLIDNANKSNSEAINGPIAGNGKIVAFVGTTKNGTSFIVNNIAQLLSQSGINTAIVDLTKNKNSYYMFTDNDANRIKTATESLKMLSEGVANGLNVRNNLTVFTALPDETIDNQLDIKKVLDTLSNHFEVVLLDCDFKTNAAYFTLSNEIYLIQSMDAFTIQPLTKFLSDLKLRNQLDERKLRIVINKYIKLKKLDAKMIVGGMSKYNEPSMTLQRDLFDPKKITSITIPFDEQTYTKYLESIALCQLTMNGYSKEVIEALEKLKNMVYPLIAGAGREVNNQNNYYNPNGMNSGYNNQRNSQGFSSNINDTLNKMRTNNY